MEILAGSSLRGPCARSLTEDLVEILVKTSPLSIKSWHEDLAGAMY